MSLVEEGRLQLDAKVTQILAMADSDLADPRVATISVRNLLEHSGGWDRAISGDRIGQSHLIAQLMGVPSPPDSATMTRYVLTRALDFAPGTRYAYSNVGYIVLAEVIAKVAAMPYQTYVKTILDRVGAYGARIGATRASGRIPGEVVYYPVDTALRPSVYDSTPVSVAYGGRLVMETMAGNGGWIASARDLGKLVAALDRKELLTAAGTAEMYARPAAPLWRDALGAPLPSYYAKGWMVRPAGDALTLWHNGGMAGTASMIVRRSDGISWVTLFNRDANTASLDAALHTAANKTKRWP